MNSFVTLQPLAPRLAPSSATGKEKPAAEVNGGNTTSSPQGSNQVNAYSNVQKSTPTQQDPQPQSQFKNRNCLSDEPAQ